jgi:hypothetical protein
VSRAPYGSHHFVSNRQVRCLEGNTEPDKPDRRPRRPQLASRGAGKAHYQSTEPDAEDWGWYIDVEGGGGSYLVGASGDAEGSTPDVDWTVQVHKSRSLKEKLLGRNPMAADDPLFVLIEKIVRAGAGIEQVSVDESA